MLIHFIFLKLTRHNIDSTDIQLAYLENNLPEELFDTATGKAWVSQWNQETMVKVQALFLSHCWHNANE